jgi:GTP cyclohydrolase I
MGELKLSWATVEKAVAAMWDDAVDNTPMPPVPRIYGVPRGGLHVATLSLSALRKLGFDPVLVETPEEATHIVDDLVDSGATRDKFVHYLKPFLVPYEKTPGADNPWLVFPWDTAQGPEASSADIFTRLLQFCGEDATRGGLLETPERAAKAWRHYTSGYGKDPASILKTFEDGADGYNELVLVKNIPVYSHCEHHMAPIFGRAHVGYIADGKIVGLSKLSRLVDMFARRLQVQERLTNQVAEALDEHLKPTGVGVVLECRHMCMEARGVCQQGHTTITSALRGVLRSDAAARAEFMKLIGS